jgi:hypothetical protein
MRDDGDLDATVVTRTRLRTLDVRWVALTRTGQKAPPFRAGDEWPISISVFSPLCENGWQYSGFINSASRPSGLLRRSCTSRAGQARQALTWFVGTCVA